MRPVRAAFLVLLLANPACRSGDAPAACVDDEDCESGSRCHPSAKICVADCRSGDDCPIGERCGADALCGCDPAQDRCPGGQLCHPEDRICVEEFASPEECGERCAAGRVCCLVDEAPLCLADARRCTPEEEPCTGDAACGPLARCDMTAFSPRCVPRGSCEVKEDCDPTEVCDDRMQPGSCAAWLSCSEDADCDGSICDLMQDPPRCTPGG